MELKQTDGEIESWKNDNELSGCKEPIGERGEGLKKKMAAPYTHEAATLSLDDTENNSNTSSGSSFFASYFASILVAFMT
jgi:hypothetical protein